MATQRQTQDSRRNVALGNGPDLPQRKTNSSTNAITHGPWGPKRRPSPPRQSLANHPARKIEKLTKQTQSHFRDKSREQATTFRHLGNLRCSRLL
jgi:hypothetical protein